jgi:hypothetical protein
MATNKIAGAQQEGSSSPGITAIEPVSVLCRADPDVHGVALEIADGTGAGVATNLDPDAALDLIVRLIAALGDLGEASAPAGRSNEAQRLITVLREAGGLRHRQIAEKLGVGGPVLDRSRRGRQAPGAHHLAELRRLVRAELKHH